MNRIRTSPRNEIQLAAAKAAIGVNVAAFIVLMICTVIPAAAQESRMYGHCGDLSVGGSPDLCVYDPSAPQTPLAVYPDTPLIRGLGSVSPDGTRIVFNEGYSSSIIYVADIDGSNKTSLGINGWYPTWSPDGLQIVYAGEEFYPNTTVLVPGNISVFELASSQTRVVAAYQSFPLEVSAGIRWSPDGDKIAFAAGGGDNVDLYTVSAGGGTPTLVFGSATSFLDSAPAWSPDASELLFTRTDLSASPTTFGIYKTTLSGTVAPVVPPRDNNVPLAAFYAPDAASIAYVASVSPTSADTRRTNPDGSGDTPLIAGFFLLDWIGPGAEDLVVNSVGEAGDADVGDGRCDTGSTIDRDGNEEPECTLIAAIDEANADPRRDIIRFDIPGDGENVVIAVPSTGLPKVTEPVSIRGESQPNGTIRLDGSALLNQTGLAIETNDVSVSGLSFTGFPVVAIDILGNNNTVSGCLIGTDWERTDLNGDPDGLGNGNGISIEGDRNVVGGLGQGNIVLGSAVNGVEVVGGVRNRIESNTIGSEAHPNHGDGIYVTYADTTIIGGATNGPDSEGTGLGNVVSWNRGAGIRLDGAQKNPMVFGNDVRNNVDAGIYLDASLLLDPEIGGYAETMGNLLEGNLKAGIYILGDGKELLVDPNVHVWGNRTKENARAGIRAENVTLVEIGAATTTTGTNGGNLVEDGIEFTDVTNSWIRGNGITNQTTETGEQSRIILNSGGDIVVGGDDATYGNFIYGRSTELEAAEEAGVLIDGSADVVVQSNFIGTDGLASKPNAIGIHDKGVRTRIVGNVISGNVVEGIRIENGSATAVVANNNIGIDRSGTTRVPNGVGIFVKTGGGLIGGEKTDAACDDPCNVISGNENDGVVVGTDASSDTRIEGNYIGTDVSGAFAVGNGGAGVSVIADGVLVGGSSFADVFQCDGSCNLIGGNAGDGVRTAALSESGGWTTLHGDGVRIEGNMIGMGPGLAKIGNGGNGVAVAGGSSDVHVGDGSAVRANVVANNRGAGILIAPGAELINGPPSYGSGNTAIGNVIFSNGGLAIDLTNSASVIFGDGENANDDRDNDSGTNTALNYPVILGGDIVDDHNTDLTVVWVGDQAAAPRSFQLSFAADEACRGYSGDARNPVTTSFISLPADETAQIIRVARIPGAPYYTATITDTDGNTSEFGNCVNGISGLDVESAAVDNNVRTKVKDVLVTLDASGSQAAKSGAIAASTTVYVARHTENPSGSLFKDESAMSPGAVSILPVQIVGGYWSIVADELGDGSSVDVCIPASVSTVSTSDVVLVHRSPLTDGAWKPTDTTVQSVDAADYLCGADAGTFGDFALATSGLPLIPTPIDPVDGATNASIQPWLRWTSAGGSNSFGVEVSTASDFSSTVFSQDSIDGDSIVVASPLAPLTTYYWHVRATNVVGSSDWSETRTFLTGTGVAVEHDAPMVDDTALLPNYPNPFHEQTTVGLRLAATGEVRLELFDLLGRRVQSVLSGQIPAGLTEVTIDGADLRSGAYLLVMRAGDRIYSRQILVVR